MKQLKQWLLFLVIFVALPFGGLALLWKDRCKESRVREVPMKDGSFVAWEVQTDCGPKMKVATEVRIAKRAEGSKASDEATVLLLAGPVHVPFTWSDGPTLTIDIPDGVEVVKHQTSWDGVSIAFTNVPVPKSGPPGE